MESIPRSLTIDADRPIQIEGEKNILK